MTTTATPRPVLGGYWMTDDGEWWWTYFRERASRDRRETFDSRVLLYREKMGSPKIGANHVLYAAADLGLYAGLRP